MRKMRICPISRKTTNASKKTNGARCEMLRRVESFPIRSLSDAVPWAEAVGLLHRLIPTNTGGFP